MAVVNETTHTAEQDQSQVKQEFGIAAEKAPTTCKRCGYGLPFVHDLSEPERRLAEHFLAEIYAGHGDAGRRSYPPAPVAEMLREDPHYMLCQTAIRYARRLLLAFPELTLPPGKPSA